MNEQDQFEGNNVVHALVHAGTERHAPMRHTLNNSYRYDTVAKLGIASGKQHLQSTLPEGIPLETAFVSPSVVHQLDASAEDAVASGSWCDVQPLLPSALSHDDAAALLEHCSVMQPSGKSLLCTSDTCTELLG